MSKEDYATRIKARLKELGMTYTDLANKLASPKYTAKRVTMYLARERSPTLHFISAVVEVLGVTPEYLLSGLGSPSPVVQKEKRTYNPAFANESQYGVIWRE